jgi:hypothetical protein
MPTKRVRNGMERGAIAVLLQDAARGSVCSGFTFVRKLFALITARFP